MPFQRERNAIANPSRIALPGFVRFAIKLAWDGTNYQGFQAQAHGNTIQDEIEGRLKTFLHGRSLRIFGWGRTDRGVHARGAVITVDLTLEEVTEFAESRRRNTGEIEDDVKTLVAKSILSALREFSCVGGVGSITARTVRPVPGDFDPRFSCRWKRYIYFISYGSRIRSPFLSRYAWQIDHELNLDRMNEAAHLLSGRHNFQWLSVIQKGEQRDPYRELTVSVATVEPGPLLPGTGNDDGSRMIQISAVCDFFLYHMMRRIVGVLSTVGKGKATIEQLRVCIEIFDDVSLDDGFLRTSTVVPNELKETAPPHGLYLDHIEYDLPI